jgi:hypothetical protein
MNELDELEGPFEIMWMHLNGMGLLMESLKTSSAQIPAWEWCWMDGLLAEGLMDFYSRLKKQCLSRNPYQFAVQIQKACRILDHIDDQKSNAIKSSLDRENYRFSDGRLPLLQAHIDFYFVYYLLLVDDVHHRLCTENEATAVIYTLKRLCWRSIELLQGKVKRFACLDNNVGCFARYSFNSLHTRLIPPFLLLCVQGNL